MITVQQLKKVYESGGESDLVLSVASLHIKEGERVAITGTSGSGKSTLLHMMSGVMEPTEGSVVVAGTELTSLRPAARDAFRLATIGYIFQDFHLLPSLTAEENVRLALPTEHLSDEQMNRAFQSVGLAHRRHAKPHELSRGQQQRVAFLRALVSEAPLILADEPTGSLDAKTAKATMALLQDLCRVRGKTLVCVTHDEALAATFPRQLRMETLNDVLKGGA